MPPGKGAGNSNTMHAVEILNIYETDLLASASKLIASLCFSYVQLGERELELLVPESPWPALSWDAVATETS